MNWTTLNCTLGINCTTNINKDQLFSQTLATVQGFFFIPIFFLGIANNFLTILIIIVNGDMHTVTNCYLLNLAVSDSLPLIVSLPFEIQFLVMYMNYYPFGQIGCKLRSLLAETSTNASILTISAFTIERFVAVCYPLRSSSLSTINRALKIQLLIWLIAILFAIPYYCLTIKTSVGCTFDFTKDKKLLPLCFQISASIFFVLPAFLLCLMYALMARRLNASGFLKEVKLSKDTISVGCLDTTQHLQHEYENHQRLLLTHSSYPRSTINILTRPNSRPSSILQQYRENSMKKSAFKML
ncbi:unnamed protein product, partial [Didymodactylos carnosus]